MRWSLRLGSVAGTEVRVHLTFFLLLAIVGWIFYSRAPAGEGVAEAADGILFILAIFTCVLLHEFGHVLTALAFGVRTPDLALLPIGGMGRLERMPERPWQELLVAVAGPAVNVVIALVLACFHGFASLSDDRSFEEFVLNPSFGERLMVVNVLLVVFNMIPAFPMDGGRVLRALLAMVTDYTSATNVAAAIGQVLAVLGGLVGLWAGNPILILIAVFIFLAARGEATMVATQSALAGVPLHQAMMTDFHCLRAEDPLSEAARVLLAGAQHDFPVVSEAGELEGLLTRSRLIEALTTEGSGGLVGEVMLRELPTVPVHYPLREAFQLLQKSPLESLPVVAEGERRVIGLLTAENVGELILIRSAATRSA